MARRVHGVYEPAGDAGYATPDGEIVQVPQDFAFADTVIATEEDLPPPSMPPSMQRPISIPPSIPPPHSARGASRPPPSYRDQHTHQHDLAQLHAQQQQQQMMLMQHPAHFQGPGPGSVPPPSFAPGPGQDPGLVTSVRGAFRRAKTTIDSSRGEMQELWSATESADPVVHHEPDPLVRLGRRIRTFWNFFEWDKEDVQRAAWIGVTVFIIVVCAVFVLH